MKLADATWPEVEATKRSRVLVIPLGSTEQHGPHLPFDTDGRIATELVERLCRLRHDLVQAPLVPYGASGEHADFGGTLLVGHDVLARFLIELVRSARQAFKGVVLISAHGGNAEALAMVERQCTADGDDVLVLTASTPGGDAHAGRTETSMMLAIDKEAVRLHLAEAGATQSLEGLLPRLRAEGVRPVSSNGVLGDPSGAGAEVGERLLRFVTDDLLAVIESRWPGTVTA
jgi:creatinine amidohydrolase